MIKKSKNTQQIKEITKINNENTGFPRVPCGPVDPCGPLWPVGFGGVAATAGAVRSASAGALEELAAMPALTTAGGKRETTGSSYKEIIPVSKI